MTITRRSFTGGLAALAVLAAGLAPAAAADLTKLTFVQEWPVPDGSVGSFVAEFRTAF